MERQELRDNLKALIKQKERSRKSNYAQNVIDYKKESWEKKNEANSIKESESIEVDNEKEFCDSSTRKVD